MDAERTIGSVTVLECELRDHDHERDVLRNLIESWRVTHAALLCLPLVALHAAPAGWPPLAWLAVLAALVAGMARVSRAARTEVLAQQRARIAGRVERIGEALPPEDPVWSA